MHAGPLAFTRASATFPLAGDEQHGEHHGEAVLVTSRQSGGACDDRTFAGHAAFGWRAATHVLSRPGGGCLRYASQRPTAMFPASGMGRGPRPGDLVTRCWDGAEFAIVAVHREGGRLCCELVERDDSRH